MATHCFILLQALYLLDYTHANPIDPTITPPPLLLRQSEGDDFVGYTFNSTISSYEAYSCLGLEGSSTWSTTSTWGYCCPVVGACSRFATSCSGKYAIKTNGQSVNCNTGGKGDCNTDFVYARSGDSYPTMWIGCVEVGQLQTSYFRSEPLTSTPVPSTSSTSTRSSTSTSTTWPPVPTTPTPDPGPPKNKAGLYAGVAIGVVAVLAIAGFLIYFFVVRRHRNNPQPPPTYTTPTQPHGGPQMGQPEAMNKFTGSPMNRSMSLPISPPMSPPPPMSPAPQSAWPIDHKSPAYTMNGYGMPESGYKSPPVVAAYMAPDPSIPSSSELPAQQPAQQRAMPELA